MGDEKPPSGIETKNKLDTSSPFYLGPQDRPEDYITTTRFDGNNYDEWVSNIEIALQARRKFGFLDGTIVTVEEPYTVSDWNTLHAMLVSWILNTIAPDVKRMLSKYKDAKKLWDNLKERYALVNGPRIQQLKAAIASCHQGKTMIVSTYYGKLTALWEELYTHEPIITCSYCKNCSAGTEHDKRREQDKLHQFLMGLCNEYYGQLRSNVLAQDPLPSLNRVYQLVTQEEKVRGIATEQEEKPEIVGFAVKAGGRGRGRYDKLDKSMLYCTHCKQNGHETNECFKIIGYPAWWVDRVKNNVAYGRGRSDVSNRANDTDFGKTVAVGRGFSQAKVNTIQKTSSQDEADTSKPFSKAQWEVIASMIGNSLAFEERVNGPTKEGDWNRK